MLSIPERSTDVECKAPAQANELTSILKSHLASKMVFESCRTNKVKPHGFSKTVAEIKIGKQKIGWAGSVVLRYLSRMVRDYGKTFAGKSWVRINLDHLEAKYPYLSRAGVDKAIQRLIRAGACEVGNWNLADDRASYDRTRWYHVPKSWKNKAEEELRYFYAPLAARIGVPAAVIHSNFSHWIAERAENDLEQVCSLEPAKLAKIQPFSKATIKRAIKALMTEGLVFPVPLERCLYAANPLKTTGSEVDEISSIVDKNGSKVDESGSEVDNNSNWKLIGNELEKSSKEEPSADECSPSVAKQDKGFIHNDISSEQIEFLAPFETLVAAPTGSVLPFIGSFAELQQQNRINQSVVAKIASAHREEQALRERGHQLTGAFFQRLGNEVTDDLYENGTDDELIDALLPTYQRWFPRTRIDQENALFDIFYYGIFQCVVGAFRYSRHGHEGLHPIVCFIDVAYNAYLQMARRADDRLQQAIEEENEELQRLHASPDERDEWRIDLSPAEKTRAFKQGLYSRNKVGWICLGGERRTDQIKISKKGLKGVERLFRLNPATSANQLLAVMDGCMKLHATYPPVPKQFIRRAKWYARKGHVLSMFSQHLSTILRELESFDSPFTKFLSEPVVEELETKEQPEGQAVSEATEVADALAA